MTDHEYQPDPQTGKCRVCAVTARKSSGACLWCGHYRGTHSGNVDPVVLKHYEIQISVLGGKPGKSSRVRWTSTACAALHCACRRYE